jgi:hypothetical protein
LPRARNNWTKRLTSRRVAVLQELAFVDRQIGEVRQNLGSAPGGAGRRATTVVRRPNARRMNDVTVRDAIVGLLQAKKKPMHYRDIANTLLKEGRYRTKSRNFLTTVAITILKDSRVKRVEPGIYALRRRG